MKTKLKLNGEEVIVEAEQESSVNLGYEDVIKFEEFKTPAGEENIIILQSIDRSFKSIFKIEPIDLMSLEISERLNLLEDYNDSLRSFGSKLKLITLNNNYNFTDQIRALEKRKEKFENKHVIEEIEREIGKLEYYEKSEQISFYFMVFGNDKQDLLKNIKNFKNSFTTRYFSFRHLDMKETEKLVKRINNLGE